MYTAINRSVDAALMIHAILCSQCIFSMQFCVSHAVPPHPLGKRSPRAPGTLKAAGCQISWSRGPFVCMGHQLSNNPLDDWRVGVGAGEYAHVEQVRSRETFHVGERLRSESERRNSRDTVLVSALGKVTPELAKD